MSPRASADVVSAGITTECNNTSQSTTFSLPQLPHTWPRQRPAIGLVYRLGAQVDHASSLGTGTSYPTRLFLPALFGNYDKLAAGIDRMLSTHQLQHQRPSLFRSICFPRRLRSHTLLVPLLFLARCCFQPFARSW